MQTLPADQVNTACSIFSENYPDSTVSVVHPQDCMQLFQDAYRSKSAVDSVSELGALLRG